MLDNFLALEAVSIEKKKINRKNAYDCNVYF